MEGESLADLAREYGLDPSEFEDMDVEDSIGDQPMQSSNGRPGYNAYYNDEIQDYMEDFEEYQSSPCPPQRPLNIYRGGTQYRSSQHTVAASSNPRNNVQRDSAGAESYECTRRQPQAAPIAHRPLRQTVVEPSYNMNDHFQRQTTMHSQVPSYARRSAPTSMSDNDNASNEPRNVHGVRLRPTSDLPDIYRGLFKFGVFNAVQSKCYDRVMDGDDNLVISAPTGSGKTVLFELAIIRMLQQAKTRGGESKCIYVAPTKALCSEKYRDWVTKFQSLGINCCELTGDTVQFGKSAWGDARNATIIVTTGEKWDSLTRNWEEHDQILSQIQLFLVDEVHILNESRGSTLEVIVSRMKTRGSFVRFVLVSATVPNIKDVANWIGNGPHGSSAKIMEFGEEYRPCKLTKHVYGIVRKKEQNDFVFSRLLDFKLYGIIKQHSVNKPVLVFCATRKGVFATAEQLLKEYEQSTVQKESVPWTRPRRIEATFHDKRLEKLAAGGIGVHHAGMSLDDRRTTEDLYLNKILRVIVATSTLAVGVNLPAHTVVIKGVKIFQNNMSQEYSDLDIMQMMGRAGRPQFDKEGIAIIICEAELKQKYEALVQGRTTLESCLHTNLSEHLNSEIGLGTISDIDSAKNWLHNSFLFQRIQQNPRHYAIGKAGNQTWQERIDEMVMESIQKLQQNQLVASSDTDPSQLASTEYGDIMSKYYIRQSTMSAMLKLPDRATLKDMLDMLCSAEEFADIKIRSGEKQIYNKLRTHDDIRFKIKKVEKACDKICLIIQAILGGISLNDPEYKNGDNQPSLEALTIFRHVERITRAAVEVAIVKESGAQVKHGMELMRCISAKAWEDRPIVLRQIEHIGEKSIKVLAQHGVTSLSDVRNQDPLRIETLLNRRPPFGHEVLAFIKQLPQYSLYVTEVSVTPSDGESPVEVELSIDCGLVCDLTEAPKSRKGKMRFRESTLVVIVNSDLDYIDFRRISTKALKTAKTFTVTAKLTKPSQSIIVQITPEKTAGLAISATYKPNLSHAAYPTMNTRPLTSVDMDLAEFRQDPNFWTTMGEGPSDDEVDDVHVQDLTNAKSSAVPEKEGTTRDRPNTQVSREPQRSQPDTAPKQLSNGNYACNHPCKDKSSCRHFCCRDGLPKPPPLTKKRVETMYPVEESAANTSQKTIEKPRPKTSQDKLKQAKEKPKTSTKSDRRIEQLDALHERNSVKANIQLPEGCRIKLDDGKSLGNSTGTNVLNTKPKPTFDMDFVDLRTERPRRPRAADLPEASDDDMPNVLDILQGNVKTPKSKTKGKGKERIDSSDSYGNPEMDNLIANMPSPPVVEISPPRQLLSAVENTQGPLLAASGKKRQHELSDDEVEIIPTAPKRRKTVNFKQPSPPLFLVDSEEEEQDELIYEDSDPIGFEPPGPRADEDFEIDTSLFDIQPSTSGSSAPSPPAKSWTKEDIPVTNKSVKTFGFGLCSRSPRRVIAFADRRLTPKDMDVPPIEALEEPVVNPFDNALAELEEWLQSGSVVIVDHMD